jgi:Holliday junction resolvasome RuvABC DNA-binding subunit
MAAPSSKGAPSIQSETSVNALVGLGWSERQARDAVHEVGNPGMTDKDLLKAALKTLSKARKA